MEFDEKDIRAVAQRRFWKRWIKKTGVIYSAGVGGMLGVAVAVSGGYLPSNYIAIAPAICVFVWMWYMAKKEEAFKKDLVEQWKKEDESGA